MSRRFGIVNPVSSWSLAVALSFLLVAACGTSAIPVNPMDAGSDGGADAGQVLDGGDAGADAGLDAGIDAGSAAGPDAGPDGGFDAGGATAPGSPTAVTATAGIRAASLSWTAPADDGGSPILSYAVAISPAVASAVVTVTGTSATVSGLANGGIYTFAVTATNAVGSSAPSPASAAITLPNVPAQVAGVVATAGDTSATLSWTAPGNDGGKPLTGYTILPSPDVPSASYSVSGTTATVSGLTNGTSYTFRIHASSAVGDGADSNPSNAIVPFGLPAAPSGVSAVAGNAQATVSWNAPSNNGSAIDGYLVTSSPGAITTNASTSPAIISGLTNGVAYTFALAAHNAAGTGATSVPSNAVTPSVPAMVPSVPTAVTATAGVRSASLTWSAPANDGGSLILSYAVAITPGVAGAVASVNGTTASVTGLANGATYTFQVTAANAVGVSAPSTASAAITVPDVPSAPTNVVATTGDASATLSWTAPASDGGRTVTGFTIVPTPAAPSAAYSMSGTTATVTGLANGTSYTFNVFASNAVGNGVSSAASNAIVPFGIPAAPTGVTAIAGNAQASVSWNTPSSNGSTITGYVIAASPGGISTNSSTASAVITGLTNGTAYTFSVKALNAAGPGPASAASNAVTPFVPATAPAAPTNVTATAGVRSASVSWTIPANGGAPISSYAVYQSLSGSAYVRSAATGSGSTVRITGLTNAGSYSFEVAAINSVGSSAFSLPSNTITLPDFPGAPTSVNAVAGVSQASVSWTAPSNGGSPVTNYTVISSPGNFTVTTADGSTTAAVETGLLNGTKYTFSVMATTAVGNGPASSSSNAVIPAALGNTSASAGTACKQVLAATPGLAGADGQYWINPIGSNPFQTFCDMTTDDGNGAGGWTFFAFVSSNDPHSGTAGQFFNTSLGTFSASRDGSGASYSAGVMATMGSSVTQMMITLDGNNVAAAAAGRKLGFFKFAPGTAAFQTGPVPCLSPNSLLSFSAGPNAYISATLTPDAEVGPTYCNSTTWLPVINNVGQTLGPLGNGTRWGAAMGGDGFSGHSSFWYVR